MTETIRPASALFAVVRLIEHDHQVLDLQCSRA